MLRLRDHVALLMICLVLSTQSPLSAEDSENPGTSHDGVAASGLDADVDASGGDDLDQLLELAESDVERLAEVRVVAPALQEVVSTVSRQKSTVGKSPAAVYVITNEMIRRSGARSIPEVLRMAPGVQVMKIDSNKWAISIRGFAERFSNKLLVQIDGRSVYTPLFAGVFWDVQDVLLEDVERIEVIRGPGATVWGANAVNGVINIITKSAKNTQGAFVEAGGGTERAFTSARAGGQVGDNGWYRAYGKWFERGSGGGQGTSPADDWRSGRGGVRMDFDLDDEMTLTLQGDYYSGESGTQSTLAAPLPAGLQTLNFDEQVSGGNVLARLGRTIDDDTNWSLQFYYDRTERELAQVGFSENRNTVDVDFQFRSSPIVDHSVIWGAGYRYNQDELTNGPFFVSVSPAERAYDLVSGFVQDEVTLIDDVLTFTAGSKFEHNDFTGFEFQPSVRLLWTPDERHSIWAAASRAVRTPSRVEDDGRVTLHPVPSGVAVPPVLYPVYTGSRGFQSEDLMAYEVGIRQQTTDDFAWDLAAFFHDYNDVRGATTLSPTFALPEGPVLPLLVNNEGSTQAYGFELSSSWQVDSCWRLFGSYSFLRTLTDGTTDASDPRNQFYVQSSWDVTDRVEFDAIVRYGDALPGAASVGSYTVMDLRMSWEPTDGMEVFVVGRNLLDRDHPEFFTDRFTGTSATLVQQEVFGGVSPMALTLGRGFWPLLFSYSFFELVGFRATRVNLSFEAAVGAVRKFVSHRVRERFLVTQSPC